MKKAVVIAVIGSGGKTTCIERIAGEAQKKGKRAAVVTTTHMWIPDAHCAVGKSREEAVKMVENEGIVYFGAKARTEGKMVFPGREGYEALCERADVMLVEADGAKEKPMKFPDWSREPVMPANTDVILLVFGLSALGKSLGEVCHRWELGREILEESVFNERDFPVIEKSENKEAGIERRIVDKETALLCLEKGYLEELKRRFCGTPLMVLLNQADDEERREAGEWIKARLERKKVKCKVVQMRQGCAAEWAGGKGTSTKEADEKRRDGKEADEKEADEKGAGGREAGGREAGGKEAGRKEGINGKEKAGKIKE